MKKRCSSCKEKKPLKDFSKNKVKKDGLNHSCRECHKLYTRAHYARNKGAYFKRNIRNREKIKQKLYKFLEGKACIDCGEDDPVTFDFDHVDRSTKTGSVGVLMSGNTTWPRIKREIDKCEIRCANCHRKRTAKQFGWRKQKTGP
jgi:hypothetical protein